MAALTLLAATLWVCWPTLRQWAERWSGDPQYSHGYLVPAFAALLLWLRRGMLAERPAQMSWWGVPVLAAGAALRLLGAFYYFVWVEQTSVLVLLAGVCVTLGGWGYVRWAWPAVAFLAFMIPLPGRLDGALAQPLQRVATEASTYVLQVLGVPATAEGNVILLSEMELGVAEACSGLRMLIVFFALATGLALVMQRSPLERLLVVFSALPIAVAANVTRIVSTALLYEAGRGELARVVYHDLAGWLMMVLAVGLLWAELCLFGRLFSVVPPESPAPVPIELPGRPQWSREPVSARM